MVDTMSLVNQLASSKACRDAINAFSKILYAKLIQLAQSLKATENGFQDIKKCECSVLKGLIKEAQNSRSEIQRYLNLGCMGFLSVLDDKIPPAVNNLFANQLTDLWEFFQLTLLRLQHVLLNLDQFLTLWNIDFYLNLLYLACSEFPDRLRPPCTTMPWTIWPALVVLWGVCWMFYDEFFWDCGGEREGEGVEYTGPFGNMDGIDPPEVFDPNLGEINYEIVPSMQSYLNRLISEQLQSPSLTSLVVNNSSKQQYSNPSAADVSGIAPSLNLIPYQDTNIAPRTTTGGSLELIPFNLTPTVSRGQQPQVEPVVVPPPQNAKHGRAEKYFCHYPDCNRSKPGAGFHRKDHLDQHLRGPHRLDSVPRLRAKPASRSRSRSHFHTVTVASEPNSPQTKKRKRSRGESEEKDDDDDDDIQDELAEERKLRKLVEQENAVLRQKIENYEARMQKYEERMDRMMGNRRRSRFGEEEG